MEITARSVPKIQTLEIQPQVTQEMVTKAVDIQATLKERGSRYGAFAGHAKLTQALKKVFFEHMRDVNDNSLNATEQEGVDMIFHKLGRIGNGDPHYKDSWVDIAGYATLVADTLKD